MTNLKLINLKSRGPNCHALLKGRNRATQTQWKSCVIRPKAAINAKTYTTCLLFDPTRQLKGIEITHHYNQIMH